MVFLFVFSILITAHVLLVSCSSNNTSQTISLPPATFSTCVERPTATVFPGPNPILRNLNSYEVGVPVNITWQPTTNGTVTIVVYGTYTDWNSQFWKILTGLYPNTGFFLWTPPNEGWFHRIQIIDDDDPTQSSESEIFSISNPQERSLWSENNWAIIGKPYELRWDVLYLPGSVLILTLRGDDAQTSMNYRITSGIPSNGIYTWDIPSNVTFIRANGEYTIWLYTPYDYLAIEPTDLSEYHLAASTDIMVLSEDPTNCDGSPLSDTFTITTAAAVYPSQTIEVNETYTTTWPYITSTMTATLPEFVSNLAPTICGPSSSFAILGSTLLFSDPSSTITAWPTTTVVIQSAGCVSFVSLPYPSYILPSTPEAISCDPSFMTYSNSYCCPINWTQVIFSSLVSPQTSAFASSTGIKTGDDQPVIFCSARVDSPVWPEQRAAVFLDVDTIVMGPQTVLMRAGIAAKTGSTRSSSSVVATGSVESSGSTCMANPVTIALVVFFGFTVWMLVE